MEELNAVQGEAIDIEGYYSPNPTKAIESMRPSGTLNEIIDSI